MDFGKRLNDLRTQSGLSAQVVAKAIGVPISTYRDWEYGKLIRGEPYVKLADVLGVSLDELSREHPFDKSELLMILEQTKSDVSRAIKVAKSV